MKKILLTFFIILFCTLNILAYSKSVIPGGESIGIKIESDGLIVVGFYKVNDKYIASDNIKIGDNITHINNKRVYSISELSNVIEKSNTDEVDVKLLRKNKEVNTKLKLVKEDNLLKTGLYVKDNVVGLGTLTYIDPVTKIWGALGHEILLSETNSRIEVKNGNILMSKVTSINKSRNGKVGSKNANILFNKKIGTINKNTVNGIYGDYTSTLPRKDTIEIANFNDIKKGHAYIYTVTNNTELKKYKINIVDKYSSKKNTTKAISFEIIDKDLINKTGGIVQGMSGSPIIQDDKLVGAVTNVLVDNVTLGYGILITTMLETGES